MTMVEKRVSRRSGGIQTIAILGTRGIPAKYGGFETAAETIALGLKAEGFNVLVACEANGPGRHLKPRFFNGLELVYFPVNNALRPLSEILYDVRSLIFLGTRSDALYMFGYGAGLFLWITKLLRKPLIVNCDGMEWMRPKFNRVARFLLRLSERFGLMTSDVIVADSKAVARYVEMVYRRQSVYLPYGTPLDKGPPSWDPQLLERWHSGLSARIRPDDYFLVLCRLEPDNNVDRIVEGFKMSRTRRSLLLVGPCISKGYLSRLMEAARGDPRIMIAGPLYERGTKDMLRWHCAGYLHGHMVGGTNPSLLEALAAGNVVIGTDVEFNREVIGNEGNLPAFFFRPDPASVAQVIDAVDGDLISLRRSARIWGPARIRDAYNWDDIIRGYKALFEKL